MKAIGYRKTGPIDAPDSLIELEVDKPQLGPRDLLVEVKGISINPVDVKVRTRPQMGPAEGESKVIGYDAAGIVRETGSEVSLFEVGDEVFYAGDISRQGSNAEFQAVDERIVGRKPRSLGFAESAGMALTSITAWELLFDSLGLSEGDGAGEALLIIGAAGGVGSILTQLAQKLTGLKVIATASRPETIEWVKKMGADHVINHHEDLAAQVEALGIAPRYVASLNGSEEHFDSVVELIQPRGHIALIDDPRTLDIHKIKPKSLSFSWEYMFARPMHQTEDIEKQHELLNRVSSLLDEGRLTCTARKNLGKISVENLKKAHTEQESGRVIGKNVLDGFSS